MGEFLDRPARLSPSLRGREGNIGITPDNGSSAASMIAMWYTKEQNKISNETFS
jgi:hypothetical protein